MATRMQQRRGTAAQWISTNSGNGPILNAGEIGWESDTNKFKMGDGTNTWLALDYFADINSTVNPAFGSSITFEGATANDFETVLAVTDPTADRTITLPNVTGTVITTGNLSDITDIGVFTSTIVMEGSSADAHELTLSAGNPTADITITFPNSTGTVATQEYVDSTVSGAEVDQSTLAGTGIDWNAGQSRFDINTTEIQARVTDVTDTEIGYLNNVSSNIQTQLDAKAALSGATFTGAVSGTSLTLSGDLTVNGTTTTINSTTLVVDDKNITLGDVATPSDVTADGGGITLKGASDKTFNWVDATDAWTSSEHINLASGKTLKYNGTDLVASQSGNSGKYLTTDGTSSSWGTVSGFSAPTIGSTSIGSGATVTTIAGLTLTAPALGAATATSINTLTVGLGAGSISTNTVVGSTALITNTTGAQNIAIGKDALKLNTTGSDNAAIGYQALDANTTGASNVAYGSYTLGSNTTGGLNTGIGDSALASNTTGTHNTGIGSNALVFSTTGLKNTGVGSYALRSNTTGSQNTALGQYALFANTTVSDNTAIGFEALRYNTTGTPNTAVGSYALNANTTGSDNTAVGQEALKANTIGGQNTAIGSQSGEFTTTGNGNTSIGAYAFQSNTTGGYNTTVGYGSLGYNTTGIDNVAVGVGALDANTNGSYNTAIGRTAGGLTTGSNNIVIGNTAQALSSTTSNSITLGNSSITTFRIPGLSISATTTALTVPSLTPTNAIGAIYGGTGLSTYTTGDILYSSASNTLAKLAAGTNGQILTLASGIPSWAAAPASGTDEQLVVMQAL